MQKRLTLIVACALLAAIGLAPVLRMLVQSFVMDGAFSMRAYAALAASGGRQVGLMGQSILLSSYVTFLATSVGVLLGILFGKTDLPLSRTFIAVFTAPLLIPPYVLAVAWSAVVGPGGWASGAVGPETAQHLSSWLFGLHGCAGVLFTAFMPIVMLLTIVYLGAVNPRLEDAGRLVSGWPAVLWRITLPLTRPAIVLAAVLVFLLTLGEIGVPSFLRYPVYPVETMTQFAAFYDFRAATAAATPLLLVTLVILAVEYRGLRRVAELRPSAFGLARSRIRLGRWRLPLFSLVLVCLLVTVALPVAVLLEQSASFGAYSEAFSRAGGSIVRSLVFAAIGASLLMVLGLACGYLIHNRALPLWRGVDALSLFLFTLPGSVIGIGLISLWNTSATNVVYGTPVIVILGYLAKYIVLPTRMTSAVLERIPPSLEHAARLCGAGWFTIMRRIVVPLAARALIAAWVVGYVFCMRDLSISMVVYPPGSDTLPVRIMTLMANGTPDLIAALCMILITVTLVPLGAAVLWWRRAGMWRRA
jgi:iron(III) transport system permease protein